jgi:hypothetical protein
VIAPDLAPDMAKNAAMAVDAIMQCNMTVIMAQGEPRTQCLASAGGRRAESPEKRQARETAYFFSRMTWL